MKPPRCCRVSGLARCLPACSKAGADACPARNAAFTLVELLAVIAIIVVLSALILPAFTSLNAGGNITKATYDVAEALENARAYAMATNTYVWVGFFEETQTQASTNPATAGIGRIILSVVASRDGTIIYNPNSSSSPFITSAVMAQSLTQLGKLVKIDNMHLQTFAVGNGTGVTFATRPAANGTAAQIGPAMLASKASQAPFQYPVGNPAPTAQYTFQTAIQFSPRGEARLDDSSQALKPVLEIGLQPTHGTAVDTNNANVAAVQIAGVTGAVKVYRP